MGRPPKDESGPKLGRLEIRVDPEEKRAYDEAAKLSGLQRSDWVRQILNRAAKRILRKAEK